MDNSNVTKIEITYRTIIFFVLFLLSLYFLFLIKDIIILLIISLLLMAALNPLATKLETYKIPRALSITITYIVFYGLIILGLALLIPSLASQVADFISQVKIPPQIIESFQQKSYNLQDLHLIASQFSSLPKIIGIVSSAFSFIFIIFTVSVISFYLLMERRHLHKNLIWFFGSNHSEQKAEAFVNHLETQIGSWVIGQATLMFIVGLLTYISLSLLNISYALPLAILAGFLEIIPNIGPVMSAIPTVAIAYFTISPTMALIVIILYVIIQQLENNLIVPVIMKKSVGINPIITIITLLVGFRLGGVIGAILSIPLFIVIKVTFTEICQLRQAKQI
jgi:predicted PurR-regulated permease PerM